MYFCFVSLVLPDCKNDNHYAIDSVGKPVIWFGVFISPFLFAGEKKLKTGEKMVPSRVVRGGLLITSSESSNFPLGLTGLLVSWFVVATEKHLRRKMIYQPVTKLNLNLFILVCCTTAIKNSVGDVG